MDCETDLTGFDHAWKSSRYLKVSLDEKAEVHKAFDDLLTNICVTYLKGTVQESHGLLQRVTKSPTFVTLAEELTDVSLATISPSTCFVYGDFPGEKLFRAPNILQTFPNLVILNISGNIVERLEPFLDLKYLQRLFAAYVFDLYQWNW